MDRQRRARDAVAVVAQQRRLDQAHHHAWRAWCAALPPRVDLPSPSPATVEPLCEGLARFGELLLVVGPPPDTPHAGLALARRLSRRLEDDWEYLFVLVEPALDPVRADAASVAIERGEPGRGAPAPFGPDRLPAWRDLRAVTVLDGAAGLRDGPSLRGLLRADANRLDLPGCSPQFGDAWGYSDVGGQLGGAVRLTPTGDGRWRPEGRDGGPAGWIGAGGNRGPFAPVERYLLGLAAPEEVGPITFLGGVEEGPDGTLAARSRCVVDGPALVERFGRRPPRTAPLRIGVAVVASALPAPATLERHRRAAAALFAPGPDDDPLHTNLFEATGGRGAAQVLPPRPRSGCRPPSPAPTVGP